MVRVRRARRALGILAVAATAGVTVFAGAAWAPPGPDPDVGFTVARTELVVDGTAIAVFSRCIGLGSETAVNLYRDGAGGAARRLPGETTPDGMVCERALSADLTLATWRDSVEAGTPSARKDLSVVMYDAAGAAVLRWNLQDAWPSHLTNDFDESGAGREIVTFVSDHTQRVAP